MEVKVSLINYKNELTDQLNELTKLEKKVANQLKSYKGLERRNIRVSKSNGVSQYHFKKQGDEKEHYIPKYEMSKIQLLVQRDYDEKIHKVILDLIKRLTKFNQTYDVDCLRNFYNNLPEGRRKLVDPLLPTDQMIIDEWTNDHPGNKNTFEKKYEFHTLKGEAVRSKSEKMIADYLYTKEIPYICEPEIVLADGRSVYPDFAVLNIRENRTIYWEHLGLIDSENYASKNFNKLMDYEEIGLVLGDTLIITMETQERPLNMRTVKNNVKCFLE